MTWVTSTAVGNLFRAINIKKVDIKMAKAPTKKSAKKAPTKAAKKPAKAVTKKATKVAAPAKKAAAKAVTKPAAKQTSKKVYFTTHGPDGTVHTRASLQDYGYTHAAWYRNTSTGKWVVTFSTSKAGAQKNAGDNECTISAVTKSATPPTAAPKKATKAAPKAKAASKEQVKAPDADEPQATSTKEPEPAAAEKPKAAKGKKGGGKAKASAKKADAASRLERLIAIDENHLRASLSDPLAKIKAGAPIPRDVELSDLFAEATLNTKLSDLVAKMPADERKKIDVYPNVDAVLSNPRVHGRTLGDLINDVGIMKGANNLPAESRFASRDSDGILAALVRSFPAKKAPVSAAEQAKLASSHLKALSDAGKEDAAPEAMAEAYAKLSADSTLSDAGVHAIAQAVWDYKRQQAGFIPRTRDESLSLIGKLLLPQPAANGNGDKVTDESGRTVDAEAKRKAAEAIQRSNANDAIRSARARTLLQHVKESLNDPDALSAALSQLHELDGKNTSTYYSAKLVMDLLYPRTPSGTIIYGKGLSPDTYKKVVGKQFRMTPDEAIELITKHTAKHPVIDVNRVMLNGDSAGQVDEPTATKKKRAPAKKVTKKATSKAKAKAPAKPKAPAKEKRPAKAKAASTAKKTPTKKAAKK